MPPVSSCLRPHTLIPFILGFLANYVSRFVHVRDTPYLRLAAPLVQDAVSQPACDGAPSPSSAPLAPDNDTDVGRLPIPLIHRFVAGLVSYPKGHPYLLAEAQELFNWQSKVDVLLYSDVATTLVGKNRNFTTVQIKAIHKKMCLSCVNLGDNKFLGVVLHANATKHGFDWLLVGDDDTTFFLDSLAIALQKKDPSAKHYFGLSLDYPMSYYAKGVPKKPEPDRNFERILPGCPPLGKPGELRLESFYNHKGKDYTTVHKDCNATEFSDDQRIIWGWPHGGHGLILSRGLLDSISVEDWQKCIDRIVWRGSDIRVSSCVVGLGGRLERLVPTNSWKDCHLSDHKVGADFISSHTKLHKEVCLSE